MSVELMVGQTAALMVETMVGLSAESMVERRAVHLANCSVEYWVARTAATKADPLVVTKAG